MQKRISLLLVIVMIVTSLLACGKEKLNTKNESYEGKTGGFYTKQAIENWNSYDEADCTNIEAENIRLSGKRTLPLFTALTRKVNIQFLTRLSFVQQVVRTILHLMVLLPFQKNIVGD